MRSSLIAWSLPAVTLLSVLPVVAQATAPAGYVELDYSKVERRLDKQPTWVTEPLYAMFVLDLAGACRVVAAVDKSAPDAPFYDVLYLDLDADRDLTDAGERFAGVRDKGRADAGLEMSFRIAQIAVPGTTLVHTKFLLSTAPKKDRTGFWFQLLWDGKHEVSGGYGKLGLDTTAWSKSLAKAPILRPCPLGPLHFATWGADPIELSRGAATHVNVIAGNPGSGPDTLCVVDENFIDVERDALTVTVIAKDEKGRTVTETSRIREHC
ncbi:MAG TPA: hypothetical protein VF384_08740 [Planctomycetota bacterium]